MSQGAKFRAAIANNDPLQIVGTINAYSAMMAEKVGHQAIYLSGGGVANASFGLKDLGMPSLYDVLDDASLAILLIPHHFLQWRYKFGHALLRPVGDDYSTS